MKNNIYLLLLLISVSIFSTNAQTREAAPNITLSVEKVNIRTVLSEIEQQSGYIFSYESFLLDSLPEVSFNVANESLASCLRKLFLHLPLSYRITGQYIIIKQKPLMYTISGFIRDYISYENLISATAQDIHSGRGTVTNNYGFYSITLPPGEVVLRASFVGYDTKEFPFFLSRDTLIDLALSQRQALQEVLVSASSLSSPIYRTSPGIVDINKQQILSSPMLLGETDVIKTIQQIPGVAAGMEGMSHLFVRGGSASENLFLLDGNPIYHVNHLFGFYSTFNPDAVKNVMFYKGGFPAEYGGRLSSIVDVRMNDGDLYKYHGNLSVGLLSARANLEGPIVKGRSSFNASVRRTWIDLIPLGIFSATSTENRRRYSGYYAFDINTKVNHSFSDRSRTYISFYMGQDGYRDLDEDKSSEYLDDYRWRWGNLLGSAGWNYVFDNGMFGNFSVGYSRYRSRIKRENTQGAIVYPSLTEQFNSSEGHYSSEMEDLSVKATFDYQPSTNHKIKFGTNYQNHTFRPEVNQLTTWFRDSMTSQSTHTVFARSYVQGHELSLFGEDEIYMSDRLKLNAGLRYTLFNVEHQTYHSFQPRLSARYLLRDNLSAKIAYSKMNQYIHQLSESALSRPSDIWVPVTRNIKPMYAHQFETGLYYQPSRGYDLSAEVYYKSLNRLIDYKDNAPSLSFSSWEERVTSVDGRGYGLELAANKTSGKLTGHIGYTLSWADRQSSDESINNGERYPYQFDNRHKINISASYKFSRKFDLSATWMYASGNHITVPEYFYMRVGDSYGNYYLPSLMQGNIQKNNHQLPAIHRLNIGMNFYRHKKNGRMGIWNISLYNAYGHENVFSAQPGVRYDGENVWPVLEHTVLFMCVPSVSYTYKF